MATTTRILSLPHFIIALSLLFSLATPNLTLASSDDTHFFARTVDPKLMGLKKEKLSHFKFYWHDTVSGNNATSIQVVNPASNNSATGFGLMNIIDNPLTVGPNLSSKLVGRAQGFYASAQQEQVGLLMVQNFHFIEGKYNGSTITVLGRNQVFDKVREMPVIGGSGLFRFARGYVQARTQTLNLKTRDAVVEYNVYVFHY